MSNVFVYFSAQIIKSSPQFVVQGHYFALYRLRACGLLILEGVQLHSHHIYLLLKCVSVITEPTDKKQQKNQ